MPSELRLHPYSILFAFLTQIRAFILPGVFVLIGAQSRGGDWWQPWMMLFVVPSAIAAVLRYVTYRYSYEANEIVIRSGLVFRNERHIPYLRIQNVDAVQRPLHRLLGVVEVRVETGGGDAPEARMSVLPLAAFQQMRERVFAEQKAVTAAEDTAAASTASSEAQAARSGSGGTTLLRLDTRELLLCGLLENRGAVVITAAIGALWEFGLLDRLSSGFGIDLSSRGAVRAFARSIIDEATLSPQRVLIGLGVLIVLLLVARAISMVWAAIRLHGFHLTLDGDDLRTEYGLLTRVVATIPRRRIQTLTIREGPLHRLFKRVAVKADTAGGRAGEAAASDWAWLAPLLRRDALPEFVRQVLREDELGRAEWHPVEARAFRREVKGWLVMAAATQAGAYALAGRWSLLLVPVLILWSVVGASKTVQHLGWALTDDAVLFRAGWLWRRINIVRFAKIQTVTFGTNPFDRRTLMARVRVDTARATESSRVNIPYLARDTAEMLHTALAHHAARREFTW